MANRPKWYERRNLPCDGIQDCISEKRHLTGGANILWPLKVDAMYVLSLRLMNLWIKYELFRPPILDLKWQALWCLSAWTALF